MVDHREKGTKFHQLGSKRVSRRASLEGPAGE